MLWPFPIGFGEQEQLTWPLRAMMLQKQCKDNSKTALLITLFRIYINSGIIMGYKGGKKANS